MLKKLALGVAVLAVAAAGAFWWLTEPRLLHAEAIAALQPGDAARGERIFWAGGCASCHTPAGAEGDALLRLSGGAGLKTEFGTFVPPNISQHPTDGIGSWTLPQFADAVMSGVSPDGRHFYPAFPYTSYARMQPSDVADLYAFMKTLPPVEGKAADSDIAFPFNIRRGIGLWKQLYLSDRPVIALAEGAPANALAGRYLVEGPGHCGECHTPRNVAGGTDKGQWLAGAAAAEGGGNVPNITSDEAGIGSWSESDIANYLETGFTPDFDTVGGTMVEVQQNIAKLTPEDRQAIAAYLKAIPAHKNGYPAR
ncbi:cytochrome c [Oryzicola mucosus]|uniref:C-type cytochrome n=1 Tax=Oryzicola mucosus TaxID=2767425 RepID=A0A8J6PKC8_9HYPH|nr:cytochrome c [Oryzicola mucosus]MBD0415938.1 c-type cytochrome [Oryzicola mucosus]